MMIFNSITRNRLLGSIEANRLVLLCGAGLSIPSPSDLPSAVEISRTCYDRYRPTLELPSAMRDDVARLAGHFYGTHEFERVFLGALVPWDDLVGQPNVGHAAVADLLICRAVEGVLSANFDPLIEHWASMLKVNMAGALTGQEATLDNERSPLVKFHGCLIRDKNRTLWTRDQMADAVIGDRIASCSAWMDLNLPGKDLLVVGFWTDWGYLNDVIVNALNVAPFGSVTVVDPKEDSDLLATAPGLWSRLLGGSAHFLHVRASGSDALNELRIEFSKVWAQKFFDRGKPLLEAAGKTFLAVDRTMTCEEFYSFRQDAEGIPYQRAARLKTPSVGVAATSFFHLLLIDAKASQKGQWYEHRGKTIRVINGAGELVSTVQERYKEPPAALKPDLVVCAGALDIPVPGRVIASGAGASVVRPGTGGGIPSLTLEAAREELGI